MGVHSGKNKKWMFTDPGLDNSGECLLPLQPGVEALGPSAGFMLAEGVDCCPIPIFVLNRDHLIAHWNRALAALSGHAAAEMIGSRLQWQAFYPSSRPTLADLILDGALEGDVDRFYHGKFRRSQLIEGAFEAEDYFPEIGDGGRWLFFTAAPLLDPAGQLVGAIETLQDVTEQKRADQALRDSEERYRLMSITDGLTGLFNSRHFFTRLESECDRSTRYGQPLSLLLLDADNFKRLNDTYGHLEGDNVLQALARVMQSCIRSSDAAFRYGGEEFAVLLPGTALDAAIQLANRLCTAFSSTPLCLSSGITIRCTISVGVSQLRPQETVRSLMRRADDGIYEAKRQGRNRVVALAPEREE
ncbi:MAG: GGDEF domain-containing protein [Azoarcus sp.]|nr:GGDEF domain-containing protein [Azoarcus sp.]